LDSSINIFELSENTAYTPEDEDFGKLIVRIVRAERSHNESKQKSQRVAKAWAQKKHHSAPGVSITNKLPGWLEGKTKEPIRINPDKAKVVRQIFEWSAQGLGKRLIARRLNDLHRRLRVLRAQGRLPWPRRDRSRCGRDQGYSP
jgi:DNA invertase Pin-like site-specific DNA recombinase